MNLKDIRQRVWHTMTRDGLLEIWLGVAFSFAAAIILGGEWLGFDLFWLAFILLGLTPTILPLAKRRYTYPRVGQADVIAADVRRFLQGLLAVSVVLGAVVLALVIILPGQALVVFEMMFLHLGAVLGLGFGAGFLYIGLRYDIWRYLLFGLVAIISGALSSLIDFTDALNGPPLRWGVFFATMAVVLLPTGIALFARFLRDYPVLDEGAADERE